MPKARGITWLVLSALLAAGAAAGWFAPRATLDWQPGLAGAQPWRWWSAAFVHWSPLHLGLNLAGLLVVAALGRAARLRAVLALAWLASWPLLHLSLLLRPELQHYGGLSGLLHAGVAAAALAIARGTEARTVWIGRAVLAGVLVKVLLEEPWGPLLRHALDGNAVTVAPLAHASGVFWGIVCAALALARDGSGGALGHQAPVAPSAEPAAAADD